MSIRNWLQVQNKQSSKSRWRSAAGQRRRSRPALEQLEDRIQPSVITVNDPSGGADNPANVTVATLGSMVTLRDAINAADNDQGTAGVLIDFDPGIFIPGNNKITLSS